MYDRVKMILNLFKKTLNYNLKKIKQSKNKYQNMLYHASN